MKKIIMSFLVTMALVTNVHSAEIVKVGIVLGFTGPIESLTPPMAKAAEFAFMEASESNNFLGGKVIESIRGDSTCVDASAATTTVERLVTSDRIVAIMGLDCSGVTMAAVTGIAAPQGIVMVSPSATSPALTNVKDRGYFFRVAPSDVRQGQILAEIIKGRGVDKVAISYTNNDYGKGLAESFGSAFRNIGGTISLSAAHEDGKADYSAEVAALDASGADHLVVFGYADQGGKGIMEAAIDTDAFSGFFGSDGMVAASLIETLGEDVESMVTTLPGFESDAREVFADDMKSMGIDGDGAFVAESYDAAAIIALAIQAAGSTDRASVKARVMKVVNAPGEKIYYGELGKAMKLLSSGGDIDYVGLTNVEFSDVGETYGQYREQEIRGGKYVTIKVH